MTQHTSTPRIAFFDTKEYDRQFFTAANQQFGYDITYFKPHLDIHTATLAQGHSAVCAFVNDTLDAAVVDKLVTQGVKMILLRCAGYNNVDLSATTNRICVARVPAYSPHAVAEHAVALMLSLNRQTYRAFHRTRDGNFALHGLLGFNMHNKTVGLIGCGGIGSVLATILQGFGMKILIYDPYLSGALKERYGQYSVSLEQLFANADIISLHCPLTDDTKYIINTDSIAKMKAGVMIINTGRGMLINTKALIAGLKQGKIGSAGLDVYEEEREYFFEDRSDALISDDVLARLLTFPNVLITSHQAFFTEEALRTIATTTLESCKQFFSGETVVHQIVPR